MIKTQLIGVLAAALLFATVMPASSQQRFKTPEEAFDTLAKSARSGDRRALARILGRDSYEIIYSGDRAVDQQTRKAFVTAYDEKHRIDTKDSSATLLIGPKDWPFPISLKEERGVWRFDTAAGRQEILYRRIGRNELAAGTACLAYYDAQNEYAQLDAARGGLGAYAQRIVSTPGQKDGLYWPAGEGEKESPLGEFIADASRDSTVGGGAPFHGYYYKILTRQGARAQGGERDYIVRDHMIGGFALVAYPADYGVSGVMTFVINQDGTLFEKDLGASTGRIASRMTAFNPDHTWRRLTELETQQDATAVQ